ncbi:YdcF family protein [Halobacillus yeomjeoni]|uniref:YdcF family protein n=1 Tax=Halobacillus yeomjeoni TaxID=311194 RepID=A0A931MVI5_9BACI|nr:YdcF family protein [Halobacillus yeomjeoni]MBH0230862.1 YdcF family protein [Halobacillus yeomjeoni]
MNISIRQIKKYILLSLASILILFVFILMIPFILGADYLEVKSDAKPSEAIILLSSSQERMEKAVELYEEGWGEKIILTNSKEQWTSVKKATELGVPEDDLISEPHASSTFENALFSKEIVERRNIKSAIVVTSDYHSRRTRMTFDDIFNHQIELSYSFASSFFTPGDGLSKKEEYTAFSEYVKLFGYWPRLLFV